MTVKTITKVKATTIVSSGAVITKRRAWFVVMERNFIVCHNENLTGNGGMKMQEIDLLKPPLYWVRMNAHSFFQIINLKSSFTLFLHNQSN
jgi:hypothetical protein